MGGVSDASTEHLASGYSDLAYHSTSNQRNRSHLRRQLRRWSDISRKIPGTVRPKAPRNREGRCLEGFLIPKILNSDFTASVVQGLTKMQSAYL